MKEGSYEVHPHDEQAKRHAQRNNDKPLEHLQPVILFDRALGTPLEVKLRFLLVKFIAVILWSRQ